MARLLPRVVESVEANVSDQFKYILSYEQALPRNLPDFYKYILDYPNANQRT